MEKRTTSAEEQADEMLSLQSKEQAEIWNFMFSFADSMIVRCAVELRLADIINSHGHPLTLSQIASSIPDSLSLDMNYLRRLMRFLVTRKIFAKVLKTIPQNSELSDEELQEEEDDADALYDLTASSKWLLHDAEFSLATMFLMETHPSLMSPWHFFSRCVRDGGIAFEKAHGVEIWEFARANPEFNDLFNNGLGSAAKIVTDAIIKGYREGLMSIGSMVDVGGGTGVAIAEIVKAYPHIKGINFDLPHVVKTAKEYDGVHHVGGDMFQAIPSADALFMKFVMHDWGDEDCIRILEKCKEAIAENRGKIIIVDTVLRPKGDGPFDKIGMVFDLLMIAHSSGGKERTEAEWKKLLERGGFPRYNVIQIQALPSIIEAFPE